MSAAVISAAPAMSMPCRSPRPSFSRMSHAPSAMVTSPIGTLMKKIQCQLAHWIRNPPARRPSEPPPAITSVKTLMACARSTGFWNSVTMSAMITPAEREAPTPWRKRPMTRWSAPVANPLPTAPAAHRGHREQEDAGEEHLAAADQVAEPAGHQKEATVGDQVRIHHPGEAGLRKTKVTLHVGQRHVHDRRVEHDHQLPQTDHDKGRPTLEIRAHGRLRRTQPSH